MRLALMRRATGRIEIASKEPPAWNGHIIESVSENTVFLVNLAKRLSRQQLLAGHIFFADLLARQAQHVLLNFGGYDHNAVKICKDQISRHDEHLAAADGHVVSHHPPAPLGIKRPDASMETGKPSSMILMQSRIWLSHTQPTAPFSLATIDISSPHGALVPAVSVECTTTSPGLRESITSISRP